MPYRRGSGPNQGPAGPATPTTPTGPVGYANRAFRGRPEPRKPGQRGRSTERHGARPELPARKAGLRPAPDLHLTRHSGRYGLLETTAWRHIHQELDRSGPFRDWPEDQDLPVVEGTAARVKAERPPDGRQADRDMRLWIAGPLEPDADPIDLAWKACPRRFDQEHFHRFSKACPGLDRAHLASAEATDRRAAPALAAYAQLRPAAPLVTDSSRPWHRKPQAGQVLTPYRTRLGFPRLRATPGTPAKPAKSVKPGSGRPEGPKNRPETRQPVHRKARAKPAKTQPAASKGSRPAAGQQRTGRSAHDDPHASGDVRPPRRAYPRPYPMSSPFEAKQSLGRNRRENFLKSQANPTGQIRQRHQ